MNNDGTKTYKELRQDNYPSIGDQLDMLWHELNNTGSISKSGDWFNSIKSIKDEFPKP